jgi:predicted MPP superfamily phosphohydrolase
MGTAGRLRLHAEGRGAHYSRRRGVIESILRVAYAGDWPARAWGALCASGALGPAAEVQRLEHRIALPGRSRPPLRLAFASDLHLGPTTSARTLDRAFALLGEAQPDLLVLGGDYVFLDATPARARELTARVAAVPARTKVAVLGNHDLWTDHGALERALEEAGARVLINDAIRLPAPHDDIAFLGIDDPWTGRPDAAAALAAAEGAPFKLAVSHSPDGVPFVQGTGVRLLLTGHTHGGHLALPGPRPLVVPGPLGKRWPFGLHQIGDLTLFVSRGLGGVEVPIRTYAPPDVAIFTVG